MEINQYSKKSTTAEKNWLKGAPGCLSSSSTYFLCYFLRSFDFLLFLIQFQFCISFKNSTYKNVKINYALLYAWIDKKMFCSFIFFRKIGYEFKRDECINCRSALRKRKDNLKNFKLQCVNCCKCKKLKKINNTFKKIINVFRLLLFYIVWILLIMETKCFVENLKLRIMMDAYLWMSIVFNLC